MATWDSTFDNKPAGTDLVGQMDDFIKATRQEVRQRIAKEHLFSLATVGEQGHQGLHRQGSARVWLSDTEPTLPTPDTSEADNDSYSGRLWIVTDSGVPTGEIKIHDGTSWITLKGTTGTTILEILSATTGFPLGALAVTLSAFNAEIFTNLYKYSASTTGAPTTNAGEVLVLAGTSDAFIAHDLTTNIFYTGYRTHGTGTITWNKLWDAGSDGSGSGLDADLLDGQSGSYYQNATNINAGTLALAHIPTILTGKSADTVDGYHAGDLVMYAAAGSKSYKISTEQVFTNSSLAVGLRFWVQHPGTYTSVLSLKRNSTSGSGVYARIYVNGVAVGTQRTTDELTYQTYTENLTGLTAGHWIEVKVYQTGGATGTVKLELQLANVPGEFEVGFGS